MQRGVTMSKQLSHVRGRYVASVYQGFPIHSGHFRANGREIESVSFPNMQMDVSISYSSSWVI